MTNIDIIYADIIYASVYDRNGNIRCIVHVASGAPVGRILHLLYQVYGSYLVIGDFLKDAEAETLIEMEVCDLVHIRFVWDKEKGWCKDGVGWTLQKA